MRNKIIEGKDLEYVTAGAGLEVITFAEFEQAIAENSFANIQQRENSTLELLAIDDASKTQFFYTVILTGTDEVIFSPGIN